MKMCAPRHRPRKIAPYVSDTFESAFERWMNTPANPAVTSSDAGIRPSSSRLRALTLRMPLGRPAPGPRCPRSRRDPPLFEVHHERGRIRLRTQVVVQELGP